MSQYSLPKDGQSADAALGAAGYFGDSRDDATITREEQLMVPADKVRRRKDKRTFRLFSLSTAPPPSLPRSP